MTAPATFGVSARSTGMRTAAVSALAVGALAIGIWLATGVSVRDVARFLGFDLVFVVAPGVTLYRALSSRPGGLLRHASLGWGLGYAISIFAFAASAGSGVREAFWVYPALVVIPAAVVAYRRHGCSLPPGEESPSAKRSLALGAVAVIALVYTTAGLFGPAPLPERVDSVSYLHDLVWQASLSAEALKHFPMEDPTVAGEPFKYHIFVFIHMASVSQVTGIELTTIAFRLWVVPALMLLVLQLAYAGRHFTRRAWAAPVAAALFLLVGDLDLGTERSSTLMGTLFSELLLSPTFLLGLVLFIPLIVLLHERLVPLDSRQHAASDWALVVLFLAGCSGAKGTVLPVVLGGLLIFGTWRLLTYRRSGPGLIMAIAMTVGVLGVSYALLYGGGTDLHLKPLRSGVETYAGRVFAPEAGEGLGVKLFLYPIGVGVTSLTLMGALVGLTWALGPRLRLGDTQVWLLALLLASTGLFFLTENVALGQIFFLWYGFVAGVVLSAGGLLDAPKAMRGVSLRLGLAALAGVCALAALLLVDVPFGGKRLWPGIQAGLLFLGVGVLVWFALASRATARIRAAAVALTAGILLAGAVDGPLSQIPEAVDRWSDPDRVVHDEEDPPRRAGLTTDLRRGLRWVRGNTPTRALIAVNNHYTNLTTRDSRYFYYSALTERRVFLESWFYTDKARRIGLVEVIGGIQPFPRRLALNDAAVAGNRRAVARLAAEHGVDYILIDRLHGSIPRRPPGRLLFSNRALDVYELA